jgi:hypothetical protein
MAPRSRSTDIGDGKNALVISVIRTDADQMYPWLFRFRIPHHGVGDIATGFIRRGE